MEPVEVIEGWYTDPYQRHEARWMSQGKPTHLVRDDGVEDSDPVADLPFVVDPVRIRGDANAPHDGSDLHRADEEQQDAPYSADDAARGAWDAFDQANP